MRLHLGASRKQLRHPMTAALQRGSWIHLGEPESIEDSATNPEENYRPFFYKRGDRLPFEDGYFSFIFSEHFFEHLFLDEACELFKECFRVVQPSGCMRVVVPDADLRNYLPPEPAGFTTGDNRWYHPDKHKTRWSIYSLAYVLEEIGFQTYSVVYCDKFGIFHKQLPQHSHPLYLNCPDPEVVFDFSYILRCDQSLVVDAFKPGRANAR